jgi:drug/metabolite transporter superfamily protein YnfA
MHLMTAVNFAAALLAVLGVSRMWRWRRSQTAALWLIRLALGVIALNTWFVIRDLLL